ncbi:hypothetical protein MTR67_026538 [Solanum verrucosum]|uniref:Uncharacterized protein n=1 Tax=Solanum verrucosum TaxID=315347 RepID=A0AAF0R318_SOLVR|nr:hypothetical protein MTR67_026538 [Solanum verrucosum]
MEDHIDTSERRESLVNLMIRGPREDQNEDNFFTNNRDGGASGDELNSPHEATRSFGTVAGISLTLRQWVDTFSCIIGKVNTFDVISTGIGENKSD